MSGQGQLKRTFSLNFERNEVMKQLNMFFFGSPQVHLSDAVWFYGGIALFIAITVFAVFVT